MSKHVIEGFIVWEKWKDERNENAKFKFQSYKPGSPSDCWDTVLVGPHSFEFDVPDDFNPVPLQVGMLEAQKKELRLKLAQELIRIDEKIANLTCLTNEVAA